jgi:5-methylcytosine-specific restriction protein B
MPNEIMTLTQQRHQLLEKLRTIDQPEATRKYFGLLKELIEMVNLPNGDARLAFVVDRDRKGISAHINFFWPYGYSDPVRARSNTGLP